MTKKKNIIRHRVDTLNEKIIDFHSLYAGEASLTKRERAFIFWYTYPGSEAFMNAGRAALRAGYKPKSAVMLGYRVRHKPEIATAITKILNERVYPGLREAIWRIAWLCSIRMFFDISDFYRTFPCKRKIGDTEFETWDFEVIPLTRLSYSQRMCIDGIDFKGPENKIIYKLPDREKEFNLLMRCYEILIPEKNSEEPDYKKTAELFRDNSAT
jgi:hypothetical protein